MRHLFFSVFFVLLSALAAAADMPKKHIFLFLAEGMDGQHLALGRQAALLSGYAWYPEGLDEQKKPLAAAESFGSGRADTRNADGLPCDTEAAATAIACGVRTKNGYLGAGPEQEKLKSFAILAKEAGWKVALLSTGPINRGPSAAFFAHVADGTKAAQIALEMHLSKLNFFGGEKLAGSALEEQIALDAMKDNAYSVLYGERDLISYNGSGRIFCCTSGRLNAQERALDKDSVSLARQVEAALTIFGDQDGFFILAEGSGIGGKNGTSDTSALLAELDEFNEALGKAFDFEKKHPSDTLILVVSTHEAGRMEFLQPDRELTKDQIDLIRKQTRPLSAILDDLKTFAKENRKPENEGSFSEAIRITCEALGLRPDDLPPALPEKLSALWKAETFDAGAFLQLLLAERDRMAGVRWTPEIRQGKDTFVTAFGVGAALFNGSYDNVDIFRKLTETAFPSARAAEPEKTAPEQPQQTAGK